MLTDIRRHRLQILEINDIQIHVFSCFEYDIDHTLLRVRQIQDTGKGTSDPLDPAGYGSGADFPYPGSV